MCALPNGASGWGGVVAWPDSLAPPGMDFDEYLVGALVLGIVLACVVGGAALLVERRLAHVRGAARATAFGVMATLGLLAVHLVPAALGVLSRGTVVLACALWVVAAWRVPTAETKLQPDPGSARRGTPAEIALAGLAVVAIALFVLAVARDRMYQATLSVDSLNFHLPGVAAWIQSGSIWQIDIFLSDVSPAHYPNNGDIVLLASVLPWRSDFLVNFAMYPSYFLTGVAVYALALEMGAARAGATSCAALVLAIPSVALPALFGVLVDSLVLFGFAAGLLFLIRHHRTGLTSDLVVAGLALGVAFGTKWYGVSAVVVVMTVWAGGQLAARVPLRRITREGALLSGLIGLAGGIWLVRNLVESANPLFPVKVSPFGVTLFDAPRDTVREIAGFTIADYAGDFEIWEGYLLPAFRDFAAAPAGVLLVGAVVAGGVLVGLWRRRQRSLSRSDVIAAGVVCCGLLLAAYSITPYTAGGPKDMPVLTGYDVRYGIPALVVAAGLLAWVAARARHGGLVLGAATCVAVGHALWLMSGESVYSVDLQTREWGAALLVAATVAIAVAGVWRFRHLLEGRPTFLTRRSGRITAVAVLGLMAALISVAGYEVQKRYSAGRFVAVDPAVSFFSSDAGPRQRVGITGVWTDDGISPILPAFGPRYENHVEYVGALRQEVLRRYKREGPFVHALRRGRYDYLIVGRGRPPRPAVREQRWAEAAGYRLEAASDRLALYRAPGS